MLNTVQIFFKRSLWIWRFENNFAHYGYHSYENIIETNGIILYLAISTMIRRGSLAIVKTNKAKGGPNAIKVQPKNSITVMLVYFRPDKEEK